MTLLTSIVAMAMGHWGNSNSNGNGATATVMIDQSIETGQRQWGNSDSNCNGTGAGATGAGALGQGGNGNDRLIAMALGQWHWGIRVTRRLIAIAMALRQGHWGKSNRSNRRQWQWGNGNDRSQPLQSIDRVDVGGVGMGILFRVFYSKR
jgi:hypothetical protein